jgi:hypothetical protein
VHWPASYAQQMGGTQSCATRQQSAHLELNLRRVLTPICADPRQRPHVGDGGQSKGDLRLPLLHITACLFVRKSLQSKPLMRPRSCPRPCILPPHNPAPPPPLTEQIEFTQTFLWRCVAWQLDGTGIDRASRQQLGLFTKCRLGAAQTESPVNPRLDSNMLSSDFFSPLSSATQLKDGRV